MSLLPTCWAWFSFRNYGFSDGANLFVFISGYTSALVFGRRMLKGGFVFGSTRRSLRVWQIYAAHKSELTSRQSMIWINIVQRQWRYFDLISA